MVISFSGHRNLNKDEIDHLLPQLKHLINQHKASNFLVGGSVGFDYLVLKTLLELGIDKKQIIIAVPFKGFEKYATRNEDQIKLTQDLNYNHGIKVIEVKTDPTTSFAIKCKQRNEYLVHHCDLLVTFMKKSQSGTGHTTNLAIKNNKKIINLAN